MSHEPLTQQQATDLLSRLQTNLEKVIVGKSRVLELMMVAVISQGHVLLEDIPGVGKTTLAKALALSLGCRFTRIQFTPDLLPSDVLGTSLYHPQESRFHFTEGPVFTHILMADEINRASPRTQSSLLEAMAERQVTVEGQPRLLPNPFVVIATQNPIEYHGTYPLPEAQLDRFALCLQLGYPNPQQELEMLFSHEKAHPLEQLKAITHREEILALQRLVTTIKLDENVARYLLKLVQASRQHTAIQLGVSPRGALNLFAAAKVEALLRGRLFVIPEDIKNLAGPVLAHRLILDPKSRYGGTSKEQVIEELLQQVPVPR